MTYSVGSIAQASDYNSFVGNTAVNTAYASSAAAQNKISALIGVGYGDRGYGQISTNVSATTSGVVITAGQWNNLRNAMSTVNTHTGSGLTLQPAVSTDTLIEAQDGTSGRPNIATLLSTLDTNRLNASIIQMAVSSALTSTRTTAWGTIIRHEFTVTFSDEDAARYFFNSGGEIRFSGSRTGGTASTINAAWTALLILVGTVKFNYTSTTYTGTSGVPSNIGYYDLTNTYQQIFSHNGAGPSYSSINYSIQARRENYVGLNGGNGTTIRFLVTFNDSSAYTYYGSTVDGTIISQIDQYKASGVLTIASPTYTTIVNL